MYVCGVRQFVAFSEMFQRRGVVGRLAASASKTLARWIHQIAAGTDNAPMQALCGLC
jgi:hypothetical protein